MHAFVFPISLHATHRKKMFTVFTDASSIEKAVYVIISHVHFLEFSPASAQITELHAVATV